MKRLAEQVVRYAALTALTVVCCGVMWWVSRRDASVASAGQAGTAPPPMAAAPKSLVAVADIRPKIAELAIEYSGKVRPWEDYSLGFEIPGRVLELGQDDQGRPLDVGARVRAGQVLARLDDRILRARRSEVVAQLEQAASDLERARKLHERGGQAITEAEYQEYLTAAASAKAQQEMATKDLEDSVLISPVDGVISGRMVEAGESVNAHSIIFQIIENHDVLLVVDVPEARIRELQLREQAVREARSNPAGTGGSEAGVFRARVHMEGRNAFGKPWPTIDAEVYRIGQVADVRTGLFEVEVRIPNTDGLLRPGMVASAEIVTDRLLAYEVPESAVIFRDGGAHLFTLRPEAAPVQAMFWEVGEADLQRAQKLVLDTWIDQGRAVLIPAESAELGPVVVRGQQRLADGQLVRVTNPEALRPRVYSAQPEGDAEMTARRLPSTEGGVN